jgi:hypothetical protein
VPVEQRPATLEFHLVDEQSNPVQARQSGEVPPGDKLYMQRDGTPKARCTSSTWLPCHGGHDADGRVDDNDRQRPRHGILGGADP